MFGSISLIAGNNHPEIGDPEQGIEPGVAFENLPDDYVCPLCGVGKDEFEVEG